MPQDIHEKYINPLGDSYVDSKVIVSNVYYNIFLFNLGV